MLTRRNRITATVLALGLIAGSTAAAMARGDDDSRIRSGPLSGFNEDPLALSTSGTGSFSARVDGNRVVWSLSYRKLEGDILQAHVHLGGTSQSGGISAFLCSNLGNGPAGTPACPPAPGRVSGTIRAADVVGPTGQGVAPGEIRELLDAIEAGAAYVNVHTSLYPGGEVRTQLQGHHG